MTVRQLVDELNLSVFCLNKDEDIIGVYCCDLLSNALVKLCKQNVWITVMNNVNVAAVAYNNCVACVLLAEGVKPDKQFLERAKEHGVNVLGTNDSTYEIATKLGNVL